VKDQKSPVPKKKKKLGLTHKGIQHYEFGIRGTLGGGEGGGFDILEW